MNNRPQLVGITGRLKSGKTVLANYLETQGYKRRSFAAILKEVLSIIGFPCSSLYGSAEEKATNVPDFGVSGRYAMQTLGTEWGRELIGPDIWVNSLFVNRPKGEYTVIDDVRFPNEVAAIRERGGIVLGVCRAAAQAITEHTSHASETQIDTLPVDAWLYNEATIEELYAKVDTYLDCPGAGELS